MENVDTWLLFGTEEYVLRNTTYRPDPPAHECSLGVVWAAKRPPPFCGLMMSCSAFAMMTGGGGGDDCVKKNCGLRNCWN